MRTIESQNGEIRCETRSRVDALPVPLNERPITDDYENSQ